MSRFIIVPTYRFLVFSVLLLFGRKISTMSEVRPKLIAFDLDYTLWPFWVDTHVDAPFHKDSETGRIIDRRGQHVKCYPDVSDILKRLHGEGYVLALASRTTYTEEAKDLVKLFGWDKYVTYSEIYPGKKTAHFKRFHEQSGIPYEDMLFFDDEYRNFYDLNPIGVTMTYIEHGMNKQELERGFHEFAQNKLKKKSDL